MRHSTLLIVLLLGMVLAIPPATKYVNAQGFGQSLPFLAGDGGPCAGETNAIDSFSTYTILSNLDTLNGGCLWNGAYVAKTYENMPAVWFDEDFSTYSLGADLAGLNGGIGWHSAYVKHTYEAIPLTSYIEGFAEYSVDNSMITNTLEGGTNYFSAQVTNAITTQSWTNGAYVGKGY